MNKLRLLSDNIIVNSLKYYLVGLYKRSISEHILIKAASLAFSILICIIPWLLVLFSAFGFFLSTEESMDAVIQYINQVIPLPGYEQQISEFVTERLDDLVEYRRTAGLIGLVGVLWLSSFLFGIARTILNETFKINIKKSVFVDKLRDFRMVFLIGVVFLVALFGSTVVFILKRIVITYTEDFPIDIQWLRGIIPIIVGFVFTWIMFFVLYRFLPYVRLRYSVLIVATTAAAVLWEIAKYLFGIYITNFANITRVYGAVTIFAGTALWLYYSSIVFLIGGVLGQLFREKPMRDSDVV